MATRSWSARWGNWQVVLQEFDPGRWGVKVHRWPPGAGLELRSVLATCDLFGTRDAAIDWACDVMKSDGARVLVLDAPGLTLRAMLQFTPAPELAA